MNAILKKEVLFVKFPIIFPILYLISSMWIQIRYKKAIFSTNLLKNYFPNNKNYFFNYVITFLQSKKISKKKKFDLIYYYRYHGNKNNNNILNTLNKLRLDGLKICTIGNKINQKNIKNFGYISNNYSNDQLLSSDIFIEVEKQKYQAKFIEKPLKQSNYKKI